MIIENKKEKTCMLIDVTIPADRCVMQKEAEKKKISKYESLCVEACVIIPLITGATGIVVRGLKKHLETTPGKHSVDSLQKTAVLGTSHSTESAAV